MINGNMFRVFNFLISNVDIGPYLCIFEERILWYIEN